MVWLVLLVRSVIMPRLYRWFFVIYAGVGLTALPLDLILEYVNRPIRMKREEFVNSRNKLAIELGELRTKGSKLREDAAKAEKADGCTIV